MICEAFGRGIRDQFCELTYVIESKSHCASAFETETLEPPYWRFALFVKKKNCVKKYQNPKLLTSILYHRGDSTKCTEIVNLQSLIFTSRQYLGKRHFFSYLA